MIFLYKHLYPATRCPKDDEEGRHEKQEGKGAKSTCVFDTRAFSEGGRERQVTKTRSGSVLVPVSAGSVG